MAAEVVVVATVRIAVDEMDVCVLDVGSANVVLKVVGGTTVVAIVVVLVLVVVVVVVVKHGTTMFLAEK